MALCPCALPPTPAACLHGFVEFVIYAIPAVTEAHQEEYGAYTP